MDNVFTEADLYSVAKAAIEKAGRTGEKEDVKIAAEFATLLTNHEKAMVEQQKIEAEKQIAAEDRAAADKRAKKQNGVEIFKGILFIGGTAVLVGIENHTMIASAWTKLFAQKASPKL